MSKLFAAFIVGLGVQSSLLAQPIHTTDDNLEFIRHHRRFQNSSIVLAAIDDVAKAWDLVRSYGQRVGTGRIVVFQEQQMPILGTHDQSVGIVDVENNTSLERWCKTADGPTLFWLHHNCKSKCEAFVNTIKRCFEIYTGQDDNVPLSVIASGSAINILGESYTTCCAYSGRNHFSGLGLFADTIFETEFSENERLGSAVAALGDDELVMAVGLEDGDVLEISPQQGVFSDRLRTTFIRKHANRIELSRSNKAPGLEYIAEFEERKPNDEAESSPLTDNPFALPPSFDSAKPGSLLIVGGNTPDLTFAEFSKLAGGNQAKVVVIPSATTMMHDTQYMETNFGHWHSYGFKEVTILHTDNKDEANDEVFVRAIREATGVWISGGEQERLADRYRGTKTEMEIVNVFRRGGVVGGTSAGAAIMSDQTIYRGRKDIFLAPGFGLLRRTVIDQHFSQERRENRLLSALEKMTAHNGIGIDEGTILHISGNKLRVLGESHVYVYSEKDSAGVRYISSLKPDNTLHTARIDNGCLRID